MGLDRMHVAAWVTGASVIATLGAAPAAALAEEAVAADAPEAVVASQAEGQAAAAAEPCEPAGEKPAPSEEGPGVGTQGTPAEGAGERLARRIGRPDRRGHGTASRLAW